MTLPEKPETAAGQDRPGSIRAASRDRPTGQQPAAAQPTVAQLAEGYAAKAGLHRSGNGNIDVLKSAGGIQGIAESILPGLVFLVAFTITRELPLALIAALAAAAVFTVVRLVQRKPLTQALAGIAGVGISAWLANSTGKAEDFYVPGFFTNAAYIVAMVDLDCRPLALCRADLRLHPERGPGLAEESRPGSRPTRSAPG